MDITLNLTLEKQVKSRHCWAAVAVSIARFYEPRYMYNQQELASSVYGKKNNNYVLDPRKALEFNNNLRDFKGRCLKQSEICVEIQGNRPIAACMRYFIGWHLVIIYGLAASGELLIADPLHGYSKCTYEDFCFSYLGKYHWTHTCLTKSMNGGRSEFT
ncbi:MAG: hypothetical protein JJU13_05820 [Balneolaceae bacterium]|nr:hypothetical protein [Balneolaceae bacterium]